MQNSLPQTTPLSKLDALRATFLEPVETIYIVETTHCLIPRAVPSGLSRIGCKALSDRGGNGSIYRGVIGPEGDIWLERTVFKTQQNSLVAEYQHQVVTKAKDTYGVICPVLRVGDVKGKITKELTDQSLCEKGVPCPEARYFLELVSLVSRREKPRECLLIRFYDVRVTSRKGCLSPSSSRVSVCSPSRRPCTGL